MLVVAYQPEDTSYNILVMTYRFINHRAREAEPQQQANGAQFQPGLCAGSQASSPNPSPAVCVCVQISMRACMRGVCACVCASMFVRVCPC